MGDDADRLIDHELDYLAESKVISPYGKTEQPKRKPARVKKRRKSASVKRRLLSDDNGE